MSVLTMSTTVATSAILGVGSASVYSFSDYQVEFGKAYDAAEYAHREFLFDKEMAVVNAQNELYRTGKSTWWAVINHFSDWTTEEFAARTGRSNSLLERSTIQLGASKAQNPPRKDWREAGIVSDVRSQEHCGSCWAFASAEAIESHYMLAEKEPIKLSPQFLMNCVENPQMCGGTGGCRGATAELAFNLTARAGIPVDADVPYLGNNSFCGSSYPQAAAINDGYHKLTVNDPQELETAIATIGPIAVAVAASTWRRYGGGILSGSCSSRDCVINHAVLAVGYDQDYWLIRNSWGAQWGESGYIRLTRANDNVTYTNTQTGDGVACVPYPGNTPDPTEQMVAGESGVLSDSSYPINVRKASLPTTSTTTVPSTEICVGSSGEFMCEAGTICCGSGTPGPFCYNPKYNSCCEHAGLAIACAEGQACIEVAGGPLCLPQSLTV